MMFSATSLSTHLPLTKFFQVIFIKVNTFSLLLLTVHLNALSYLTKIITIREKLNDLNLLQIFRKKS